MKLTSDIAISGAGFAGLALGAALAKAGLRVTIVDPALGSMPKGDGDPRASTLVAGARRLLEALGAWEAIAPEAEPVRAMEITDGRLADVLRPVFLSFAGEAGPGEPFAHVAPNGIIRASMFASAKAAGVEFRAAAVRSLAVSGAAADLGLTDGSTLSASLAVAADGMHSPLRGMAGIRTRGWRYDQSAIVLNVLTERPHEGVAVQHFLEGGPFALLPLPGNRASVVWSERRLEAARLNALPDAAFRSALQARAGAKFGEITPDGPRGVRPLEFSVARNFATVRVALIGDAAHAVHPLAGQGLNIGLRDVAALAETIVDAARLGSDIGALSILDRYETWRRFDTMMMMAATDGLLRLFIANNGPVRTVRDIGLGAINRMPSAKAAFIRSAAGLSGEVPRLMRGEGL